MRASIANLAGAASVLALVHLVAASASASVPGDNAGLALQLYTVVTDGAQLRELASRGLDVAGVSSRADGRVEVDLVLTSEARRMLSEEGLSLSVWRDASGRTIDELASAQQEGGYDVWRPFDGAEGLRQQLYGIAERYPDLVSLQVLGTSVQDREIIAVKVTKDARDTPDGSRPAVLYLSGQHAREWIGPEVNRRLLSYFLEGYGVDEEVTRLVDTRELWFVLVANPDGYEFTFLEGNRLWRKNLRDNDGDGRITGGDGVDPNRNYPAHWGYDDRGSSPNPSSESYRGPAPASEPETVAMIGLVDRVPFAFAVNYHSVAQLLLYPVGWMEYARSADTALFEALAGRPDNPAISGYLPIASWQLYPTNGETCDYAYGERGIVCFTPEMSDGGSGQGFVFPDDESLVAQELAINLPFALSLARSAADPARPDTHLGIAVPPLQVEAFPVSYGTEQAVQAIAAQYLGPVTLHWRINDGPEEQSAPTAVWPGGERYGAREAVHYKWVRGEVSGAMPGDRVTVWFRGGGAESEAFTYEVVDDGDARVLVLAAEDYSGTWPTYQRRDGPTYLDAYLTSLSAMGREADVYDVDAAGRTAPDPLGVLSHYDAVIWYTGDDFLTTEGDEGGRAPALSRVPHDTMLAVRDYLNEGGRLLFAGARAGQQFHDGYAFQVDPDVPCEPRGGGCDYLGGTFLVQYLGAAEYVSGTGVAGDERLFDAHGTAEPLDGFSWSFGAPPAGTTPYASAWVPTDRRLSADAFPLFSGRLAASYDWPGLVPRSGEHAAYSDWRRYGWTRLVRDVDLSSASRATLSLWVARDTLPGYGWFFVEAHTVDQDDWQMLPDDGGHTTADSGDYCLTRIQDYYYPQLRHYVTRDTSGDAPTCISRGSSGSWNAATGASDGWERWQVDLDGLVGRRIELVVSYLAGPSPRVGVVLDDLVLTVDGVRDEASFEEAPSGWVVGGPPPGSRVGGGMQFARVAAGFVPAGPVVVSEDTVLLGFEPAHIEDAAARTALLERLLDFLAPPAARPAVYLPLAYRSARD